MAYIEIDIDLEEHIDEIDTDVLVDEIKRRVKAEKTTLSRMFSDRASIKEDVCDILGLNYLASNEDILAELLYKLLIYPHWRLNSLTLICRKRPLLSMLYR